MIEIRNQILRLFTVVAALALVGCTGSGPAVTNTTVPVTVQVSPATIVEPIAPPVETSAPEVDNGPALEDLDWTIDWDGVGPVKVGVTLEETADALGPGFEIGDEEVLGEAISGHAVSLDDEVLLYIASSNLDDEVFELLLVESERLSLESGLHIGMTITEAVELHGAPEFWFHTVSHGREGVSFADGTGDPGETIHLGSAGIDQLQAGIYGEAEDSDPDLFKTVEFDPAGTIDSIAVTCFGPGRQSCPPSV